MARLVKIQSDDPVLGRIQDQLVGTLNPALRSLDELSSATGYVAAKYMSASGQSLASGTPTIINFESRDIDTSGAVKIGPSWAFTVPVGADGIYVAAAELTMQPGAAGNFTARIDMGGNANWGDIIPVTNGAFAGVSVFAMAKLSAGQTISVFGRQITGAPQSLFPDGSTNYVSIFRLPGS